MKIFYILHRIPYPPNKGEKARAFHHIRYLARKHTVHLAFLVDARGDLEHVKVLEAYCGSVDFATRHKSVARLREALGLFPGKPLSVASFYSRDLERKVTQRLRSESFDLIMVFSSSMAAYVQHVTHVPKVMDFVDVDSEKWRLYAARHTVPMSWIYKLEAKRLARYEENLARTFDHSILVSEREASLLRCRVPDRPISVIPCGVDLEFFSPPANYPSCSNQPAIVFTGTMDYFPNIDAVVYFCGEIFPLIRRAVPDARFYVVGRNPTRRVKELARHRDVTVTGSVADVRPYLRLARVSVAPLRIARGMQSKILESMAMGIPVVGTSEVFQATQATLTDGIRIADEPQKFAREVTALLKDPGLHLECSLQARQYVERHYRWQDQAARLEFLLEQMSGENGAPCPGKSQIPT